MCSEPQAVPSHLHSKAPSPKGFTLSQISATSGGPIVQTPEPVGDISVLNHSTDIKQTCALKSLPPQFAAGLDLQLRFSEAPSTLFPSIQSYMPVP